MKTIHDMFSTMMTKLQKLDTIENNINDLKHSLEYAQAEIADLRKENEEIKSKQDNRFTSEVYARQPVVIQHTRTREGEYNRNYT
jgi:regulator of replication initiation timing